MEIHIGMGDKDMVILVSQADRIELHVLDGYQTPHRAILFLLLGLKRIYEKLIIPRAILQAMRIDQHIAQPHMGELDLLVPQRKGRELGVRFAYESQRISLEILQIDIAYREPRRELVTDGSHLRIRAQGAGQFLRRQLHGSRLHFITRQSSYEGSAYQRQTGEHHSQYVQRASHSCIFSVQRYEKYFVPTNN